MDCHCGHCKSSHLTTLYVLVLLALCIPPIHHALESCNKPSPNTANLSCTSHVCQKKLLNSYKCKKLTNSQKQPIQICCTEGWIEEGCAETFALWEAVSKTNNFCNNQASRWLCGWGNHRSYVFSGRF